MLNIFIYEMSTKHNLRSSTSNKVWLKCAYSLRMGWDVRKAEKGNDTLPHRLHLGVFEPYSPLPRKKGLEGLWSKLNYFLVIKAFANFVRYCHCQCITTRPCLMSLIATMS